MTDAELIARLRELGEHASFEPHVHHTAADRIEALTAKIKLMDDLDAINGEKIEALEAKLAKAVALLNALDATLDRNGWHVDSIAREDIRATLAEIK